MMKNIRGPVVVVVLVVNCEDSLALVELYLKLISFVGILRQAHFPKGSSSWIFVNPVSRLLLLPLPRLLDTNKHLLLLQSFTMFKQSAGGYRMFRTSLASTSSSKHSSSSDDKHNGNESKGNFDLLQSLLIKLTEYQNIVISLSLGSFLLYFLWLREESDIDDEMKIPIWQKVDGIDPVMASRMIECDRKFGLDVKHSEKLLEQYKKEYYEK
jgi:hypothetical protein